MCLKLCESFSSWSVITMHPSRWTPPNSTPQTSPSEKSWIPPIKSSPNNTSPIQVSSQASNKQSDHHIKGLTKRTFKKQKDSKVLMQGTHSHPSHIFKSKSNSSRRVQAAHIAHLAHVLHRDHKLLRKNHKNRKLMKDLKLAFVTIDIPPCSPKIHPPPTPHSCLINNVVVVDGGDSNNTPLQAPNEPLPKPWKRLSVHTDLRVVDTKNFYRLLSHTIPGQQSFAFCRPPRLSTLQMTNWHDPSTCHSFLSALSTAGQFQKKSLTRGKDKVIFGSHKYVCLGVQPLRAKAEVSTFSHHASKMHPCTWNLIVQNVKCAESVAASYLPTQEISRMFHSKQLNQFPCLQEMQNSPSNSPPYQCKMYGALAFGLNVHLSCHSDEDFNYSISFVMKEGHTCSRKDRIMSYFCFPSIGTAVAMRPGDLIIFDPTLPHCISSRCNNNDNIYCISLYLKTRVVGLNNNQLDLTPPQHLLSSQYHKSLPSM